MYYSVMRKSVLGIVILIMGFLIVTGVHTAAKDNTPAVSTQGVENLDQTVVDSKPAPEEKYDLKAKIKATKKYFKDKKAINKQDKLRTNKIKEIEYLNKRLEEKKKQLESLNPTEEKGENEE